MHRRLQFVLDVGVALAALATIPLTIAEGNGDTSRLVRLGDWIVWAVFVADYVIMLAISEDWASAVPT